MNLCVVDERNPCVFTIDRAIRAYANSPADLREHALFTLRNVLHDNAENQAIVDQIKPSANWDEEGVLRETAGATRR
jgi:ataxin-10